MRSINDSHRCMNCGLPLIKNEHPQAGVPSHVTKVGTVFGCLACAELRASGRGDTISKLRAFLIERIQKKQSTTIETVLGVLEDVENRRIVTSWEYRSEHLDSCVSVEVQRAPSAQPPQAEPSKKQAPESEPAGIGAVHPADSSQERQAADGQHSASETRCSGFRITDETLKKPESG